jgi:CheY-like chemotaxis protein
MFCAVCRVLKGRASRPFDSSCQGSKSVGIIRHMESKPRYKVGVAGLELRDVRLIEIVFRHSQYNRYEFELVQDIANRTVDMLIVNTHDASGQSAMNRLREHARKVPVIAAVPRGEASSSKHAISIDRLTLQLLPIMNRVVEIELGIPITTAPMTQIAQQALREAQRQAHKRDKADHLIIAAMDKLQMRSAPTVPPSTPAQEQPPVTPLAKPALETGNTLVTKTAELKTAALSISTILPRILIVDDSPTVTAQLKIALGRYALHVEVANDGVSALAMLANDHFDLAIVDVIMPELNGFKLTKELRRLPNKKQMPVILLSSRAATLDQARGSLAGCNEFLAKPVPLPVLKETIFKHLRRHLAVDDPSALQVHTVNA